MESIPRNVLLYGAEAELPRPLPLRAGPLSLLFEAGDLRYVRLGDREMLRRVYVAVRDRNWGTIPMQISDLKIDAADDRFTITYNADHRQGEIDFHWQATIQGTSQGSISFVMQGQARSTFLRNRIGFCVLHPPDCAGTACRVVQEFGDVVEKPFPRQIVPAPKEDPFQEIREMSWLVENGVAATLRFEGDLFETEDQRNWIDGSYKTFCTPLRLPFPVEIKAGTQISQRVELTLEAVGLPQAVAARASPTTVWIDVMAKRPLLDLGACLSRRPHTDRQIARLKALNLAQVRTDLHLNNAAVYSDYLLAVDLAEQISVPLEIALYVSNRAEQELAELAGWVRPEHAIVRWLIFQEGEKTTRPETLALARRILTEKTPAQFGGGSAVYFTELNRERPNLAAADVIAYSVNPQVHAFDNTSLSENAQAIAATVESAREIYGNRPIAITPITLRPRFNPDATGVAGEQAADELPFQVDPRQMSLFGAAWTLAAIHSAAESGAASATFYETIGWLGLIERDEGSLLPSQFRSAAGGVFPIYHLLALVSEFRGGEVVQSTSSQPLSVTALVLRKENQLRAILANETVEPQQVAIDGIAGSFRVWRLDERNALAAMNSPEQFRIEQGEGQTFRGSGDSVALAPYGLAWLDAL